MIALGSGKGFQSVYLSAGFSSLSLFCRLPEHLIFFSDPGKFPKHGLKKIGDFQLIKAHLNMGFLLLAI